MINTGYEFPRATVNLIEIPSRRGARVPTFSQLLIGPKTKMGKLIFDSNSYGRVTVKNLELETGTTESGAYLKLKPILDEFLSPDSFAASFVGHLGLEEGAFGTSGEEILYKKTVDSLSGLTSHRDFIQLDGLVASATLITITVPESLNQAQAVTQSVFDVSSLNNTENSFLIYSNGRLYAWPFSGTAIPSVFNADSATVVVGPIKDLDQGQSTSISANVQSISGGKAIRITFDNPIPNVDLKDGDFKGIINFNANDGTNTVTVPFLVYKFTDSSRKTVIGWFLSNVSIDASASLSPTDYIPFRAGESVEIDFLEIDNMAPAIYDGETYKDDDPENVLGFGAYVADRGAGYIWIYPVSSSTENLEDVKTKILNMVEKPYYIHVLTNSALIQQDIFSFLQDHEDEFMIMTSSIQMNDDNSIVIDSFYNPTSSNTISAPPGRSGDLYQVGDLVTVGAVTATVQSISYNDTTGRWELSLSSAVAAGTVTITRRLDPSQLAEYVATQAGSWESKYVWPFAQRVVYRDLDGNDHVLPPFYLAVLHTSIYSHQPIRRPKRGLETRFFYGVTDQLDRFDSNDLRILASGGVTVYIQPNLGGPAFALDGLTSDMRDDKTMSQAITLQVFVFARMTKNRISHIPLERWMMSEADDVIRLAFGDVYAVATEGPEPIVGPRTAIQSIEDDPAHPNNGKIVTVRVETQYGFDFLTFNVYY